MAETRDLLLDPPLRDVDIHKDQQEDIDQEKNREKPVKQDKPRGAQGKPEEANLYTAKGCQEEESRAKAEEEL